MPVWPASHDPAQSGMEEGLPDIMGRSPHARRLSVLTEEENSRAMRNVDNLNNFEEMMSPKGRKTRMTRRTFKGAQFFNVVDVQGFVNDLEETQTSLADLKQRLVNFDPSNEDLGSPGGKRATRVAKPDDHHAMTFQHEEMDLESRIDAYKMCRRIEPDLPPLTPLTDEDILAQRSPKKSEAIVNRNASPQELQRSTPAARRARAAERKQLLASRLATAAQQREAFAEQTLKAYATAEVSRINEGGAIAPAIVQKQCAQRWFSVLLMAGFAKQLREELQVRKMSRVSLLMLMETQHERLKVLGQTSKFVADALKFREALQEQQNRERFEMVAHMLKRKLRVKIRRQHTKVIARCLSSWKLPARCFISLRKYASLIKMLQRWWRETSKHLKEQRDHIVRRWLRLEHPEQFLETAKPGAGMSSAAAHDSVTVKKKATLAAARMTSFGFNPLGGEDDPITSQRRNRCVEYELRYRRYELLPRIYLWEDDFEAYLQGMKKWRIAKQEAKEKGENVEQVPAPLVQWPPMRPTYAIPGHLRSEEKGGECPPWCPGRVGDQQILDMAEQFRRNPAAWHVCPFIKARGHDARGTPDDAEQAMGMYGPPPSTADLQQWGAEPGGLPGIHAHGRSRVRHGGEPRTWASSLFAASSGHVVGFRPVSALANPSALKM